MNDIGICNTLMIFYVAYVLVHVYLHMLVGTQTFAYAHTLEYVYVHAFGCGPKVDSFGCLPPLLSLIFCDGLLLNLDLIHLGRLSGQ